MTEHEFMHQLFLLKCDMEACPMRDRFAAEQRERWTVRLADLLNRRHAAREQVEDLDLVDGSIT